jgi:hypothetical protein
VNSLNRFVFDSIRDDYRKWLVWGKGTPIPGRDPNVYRDDRVGKVIRFTDYGDRSSEFGWEIDHYPIPVALGGTDDIANLWPLNCADNARLGGSLGMLAQGGFGRR